MSPAKGRTIQLSNVRARIPDLNHESILSIQGDTTASAMSYLSLMRHSPLGGLLEHVFDAAQGDGDWSIPLQLTIPLRRVRDTSVREIGRASCRERVCQYVSISVVAVS